MKRLAVMLAALASAASAQTNDILFLDSMTNALVEFESGRLGISADVAANSSHYASSALNMDDLLSSGNLHYAIDGLSLRLVFEYEFSARFAVGAFAEVGDLRREQDLDVCGVYFSVSFGSFGIRSRGS